MVNNPDQGEALEDEWEGARGLHFGKDAYRLIWEVDHAESLIVMLRAGKKKRRDGTIYDELRPITGRWPPDGITSGP